MGEWTYRLELVRCGKKRCQCMRGGALHGPYWYAYRRVGERTEKRYAGSSQTRAEDRHWRDRDKREDYRDEQAEATKGVRVGMKVSQARRVLGLYGAYTLEELRRRRNALVMQHHPDKSDDANATDVCARINEAYAVLRENLKGGNE